MDYLPIFVDIKNKPCLVIGGGDIAYRKISLLLKAGANITCVAQKCTSDILKLVSSNKIVYIKKKFSKEDINKQIVIICATANSSLNEKIAKIAHKINILVNVVDNPDLCSFIMPSIVERFPIIVAISSSAKAPILSRLIRTKLEGIIPHAYGQLAQLVDSFRDKVKIKFSTVERRRVFWEKILSGSIAQKVFSNKLTQAKIDLQNILNSSIDIDIGEVYLVGSGPGDVDLLTFKALRLMQQSDVVLYDRLVSSSIVNLVRRDAQLIYVGKGKNKHVISQSDINKLLVSLAKEGKRVCRLKGGDPFIFGRGGEEIEILAENNIPFQVVPGITAASGCSTYAGIPLTHRDYSQSCRFVTGHLKDGTMNLPWHELVTEQQTIVFYMALAGAKYLATTLIQKGMRPTMPIAIIENGTTPQHKVHVGSISSLAYIIDNADIKPPALIIVGEVVKLRKKLQWFD